MPLPDWARRTFDFVQLPILQLPTVRYKVCQRYWTISGEAFDLSPTSPGHEADSIAATVGSVSWSFLTTLPAERSGVRKVYSLLPSG